MSKISFNTTRLETTLNTKRSERDCRRGLLSLMAVIGALQSLDARAVELPADDDWLVRWDNTLRASAKFRVEKADPALSQSFNAAGGPQALNFNAGDQNFQKRGVVSRRMDLLSEFDAIYRKDFGVRVTGAGWYDYDLHRRTDATDPLVGQRPVNEFTADTRKRAGRKAEILDAFVFGGTRLDNEMKLTGRLGRHTLQYGETLFFGSNGIARAQGPVDIDKLTAAPNAQFKEILRPVPQVSAALQITPNVSVGGYYQFRWEADRLPPAGTYFSNANLPWGSTFNESVAIRGGSPIDGTYSLAPAANKEPRDSGQFGLQLRWRLDETDLGLYFAKYHDKGGVLYGELRPLGQANAAGLLPGTWYYLFPDGVKTVGVSVSRSIDIFNIAAEASVRDDMPLRNTNIFWPSSLNVPNLGIVPGHQPQYATGRTAHINFSWVASLPPNFISNEVNLMGEIAWNRVLSRNDPDAKLDSGRTRDAMAIRMIFSPVYRQVLEGLDMSVPIGVGYTLKGNSAVTTWGAKDTGDISIGLDGTYLGVWQFGASYIHYIGKPIPLTDYTTRAIGLGNPLADRNFVVLSLRRTF